MISDEQQRCGSSTTVNSLVTVIKDTIRAQSTGSHGKHLSTAVRILSVFAAAGHTQYAEGTMLYV